MSAAPRAQFSDLPGIFLPATNTLKASLDASSAARTNPLPPVPQTGTNSSTLAMPGPGTNSSSVAVAPGAATNSPAVGVTNSMDSLDDKYKLAIGDRLSFRIIEDEEPEPKPLFVTDSGDLEVPYLGRFPALGKSCKELAFALKAELEKDYYYHVNVILAVDLMTKSRGKVYLVGPVRAPGPQEIPSDEVFTLSKAILRAGGFSDFADKKNVKITRKSGREDKTFTVNVADILEKGKTEADLTLEPGDFIYVPERSIRF
jgi:protein involved in polysaccharide export with SLBB domain